MRILTGISVRNVRTHSGHVCAFYASHSLGVPEKQPWCVVPKPASLSFLWSLGILNPIQKKNVPPFFWNYGCEYLVFLCICAHMNVNTPICTLCRWFLWGGFFLFVCLGFFCGFLKKINNLQLSTEDERALQMEQNLV